MSSPALAECDDSQLCKELRGVRDGIAFHEIYRGNPDTRVIRASASFALVADISPLAPGHTLLVPKAHYFSFGKVPESLYPELESFRLECITLITDVFGAPAVLEHGASSTMRSSPCISHAHWHLIPNAQDATRVFEADGLVCQKIPSWTHLRQLGKADHPYIYYGFGADNRVYAENLSKRHQYLRVVVAEIFGIPEPEWDWALTLHPERLRDTVESLAKDRVA